MCVYIWHIKYFLECHAWNTSQTCIQFSQVSYTISFLVVVCSKLHICFSVPFCNFMTYYTWLLCCFLLPLLSKLVFLMHQNSKSSVLFSSRRIHSDLPILITLPIFYDLPLFIYNFLICPHYKIPFSAIVFYFQRQNQISLNLVTTNQHGKALHSVWHQT